MMRGAISGKKGFGRNLSLVLLSLVFLVAPTLQAGELGFRGGATYSLQGNRLYVRIAKMANGRNGGYSGSLKFELWATSYRYGGGSIRGYSLGSFTKSGLTAGYSYSNMGAQLRSRRPPAGSYYVTLTVSEFNGGYRIVDYINFDGRATFYPQQPAGKPLAIVGATRYRYQGSTLQMNVAQIVNRRPGGYSGTLLLRLWATPYPYRGGSLRGYLLGTRNLGYLNGGNVFNKVSGTVPLARPPDGSYYITMTLSEYRGDEYMTVDYVTYNEKSVFTAPKKPDPKPVRFVGSGGYKLDGSNVILNFDKITNANSGGNSGTLKVSLVASAQPYRGGNVFGYTLGSLRKEQLKGGFVYSDIRQSVPLTRPPAGSYYVTLVLSEYRDDEYIAIDYINFPNKMEIAPEKPAVAPLRFAGNGGYSWKDDRLTLTCDKIVNEAAEGTTGTLQVQLWATEEPYKGGDIDGFLCGSIRRDGLKAGNVYKEVDEQTDFKRPPPGTYNMTLILMEYDGEEYVVKDSIPFSKKREFTAPEPEAPAKPIHFVGYSSYAWDGNKVTIKCDKISNTATEGESGGLRLRLWATDKPYAGGGIDGYVLADLEKDPLKAGYYYDEIDEDLDGKKPPAGEYSITLTLSEKRKGEYVVVDYITFDKKYKVAP